MIMTKHLILSLIFIFFVILVFSIFYKEFIKAVNLYDLPDNDRKIHANKTALIGGSFLMCVSFSFLIFHFLMKDKFSIVLDIYFFILLSVVFLVGFVNDKISISPYIRILLLSVVFYISVKLNPNLLIESLNFQSLGFTIYFHNYSFFFSILCFLLFINALNMFDGINLQCIGFSIFFLSVILLKNFDLFLIYILFGLFVLLIMNYKNITFLGDNGVYVLAFIISFYSIESYNLAFITPEEIFILMAIPGLDMFRLFIERIYKKKHPFFPDRRHLHHLLLNKFGYLKSIILLLSLNIIPYILYIISGSFLVICSIIILYLFIYFRLGKDYVF